MFGANEGAGRRRSRHVSVLCNVGRYAYAGGWNPAGVLAFAAAVLPNVPGFLATAFPGAFGGVPAFFKQFGSNPLTSNANLHAWSDEQLAAEASGTSACSALLQFADNKGGLIEEWPEPLRVRQMPEVSHD